MLIDIIGFLFSAQLGSAAPAKVAPPVPPPTTAPAKLSAIDVVDHVQQRVAAAAATLAFGKVPASGRSCLDFDSNELLDSSPPHNYLNDRFCSTRRCPYSRPSTRAGYRPLMYLVTTRRATKESPPYQAPRDGSLRK